MPAFSKIQILATFPLKFFHRLCLCYCFNDSAAQMQNELEESRLHRTSKLSLMKREVRHPRGNDGTWGCFISVLMAWSELVLATSLLLYYYYLVAVQRPRGSKCFTDSESQKSSKRLGIFLWTSSLYLTQRDVPFRLL